MTRKEFRPGELSDHAFSMYSNSDVLFFVDDEGAYYWAGDRTDRPVRVGIGGTLEDVEELLLAFYEDEDDEEEE